MSAASEFAGLEAFGGEEDVPAVQSRARAAEGVERPVPQAAEGEFRLLSNAPLVEIEPVSAAEGYVRYHERRPADFTARKRVLIYGVAGAFVDRPTARLRSYRRLAAQTSGAGIDEVWCVAIHKPLVLGLWSVDLFPLANFRLLCDETGRWTRETGLADAHALPDGGTAAVEYSLLVSDGTVLRLTSLGA